MRDGFILLRSIDKASALLHTGDGSGRVSIHELAGVEWSKWSVP